MVIQGWSRIVFKGSSRVGFKVNDQGVLEEIQEGIFGAKINPRANNQPTNQTLQAYMHMVYFVVRILKRF